VVTVKYKLNFMANRNHGEFRAFNLNHDKVIKRGKGLIIISAVLCHFGKGKIRHNDLLYSKILSSHQRIIQV
jgi:hypothetical protein